MVEKLPPQKILVADDYSLPAVKGLAVHIHSSCTGSPQVSQHLYNLLNANYTPIEEVSYRFQSVRFSAPKRYQLLLYDAVSYGSVFPHVMSPMLLLCTCARV